MNIDHLLDLAFEVSSKLGEGRYACLVTDKLKLNLGVTSRRVSFRRVSLLHKNDSIYGFEIVAIYREERELEIFEEAVACIDEDSVYEMVNLLRFVLNPCCLEASERMLRMELLWNCEWSWIGNGIKDIGTRRWFYREADGVYMASGNITKCEWCRKPLPDPAGRVRLDYSNESRFASIATKTSY